MASAVLFNRLSSFCVLLFYVYVSFFAHFADQAVRLAVFGFLIVSSLAIIKIKPEENKLKISREREDIFLWVFFFICFVKSFFSQNPAYAFHHFYSFVLPAPIFYYFGKVCFRAHLAPALLRKICFIAFLVCLFGILEVCSKSNYIYDHLWTNPFYQVFRGRRMMATQIHPVVLGSYLAAILTLALSLFYLEKKFLYKFLALFCFFLISIAMLMTFSRSAFLALFFSCFMYFSFYKKVSKRVSRYFIMAVLISAMLVACFTFLSTAQIFPKSTSLSFQRYSPDGFLQLSDYVRKWDRLTGVFKIVADHPFFGLGLGHFRVCFDHYLPDLVPMTGYPEKVADLMYLTILAETGLAGFSCFFIFFFLRLRRSLQNIAFLDGGAKRTIAIGCLSAFIGIATTFLTYDGLYWLTPAYLFWFYAGTLSAA